MESKGLMNKRCPLKLKCFPDIPCPLAIQRLKVLAHANKNLSYLQESKAKGCDYYIFDRDSNYCFFKYIYDNQGKTHSTIEIAELLFITQAAVYSSQNRAIAKFSETSLAKLLKD